MKLFYRFRSAITGRFVSKLFAMMNPKTTVREKPKPKTWLRARGQPIAAPTPNGPPPPQRGK